MTTIPSDDIRRADESPAHRLRRTATAARVQFTSWGASKALTDRQKEEAGLAFDADARLLTAGKRLVDSRHPALRALTAVRSRCRQAWLGMTLPYVEPGVRLLRHADIDQFVHLMTGFKEELAEAATELARVYEAIKADARQRLGRLYADADYPADVQALFAVTWDFPSVEPPSFLMRLSPELYAEEQARVSRRFEEAVRLAEQAFLAEFAKVVGHLTERLTAGPEGERKVFRDSAVSNLMDFFQKFRTLNVRSSPQLDELVDQVQRVVGGVGPQELRNQAGLRQNVATHLAAAQSVLDGMLVDRPRRSIVRPLANGGGG